MIIDENYEFKTDREKQWMLLEERDRLDGRSSKFIERDKKLFFDGPSENFALLNEDLGARLKMLPNRKVEGWQQFISKYFVDSSINCKILSIQISILTGSGGMFGEPEDDAYYVYSIFGPKWEHGKTMNLVFPTQDAMEPVDSNMILACSGANLTSWLKQEENDDFSSKQGYLRFIPEFFELVPHHVDARLFDDKKYRHEPISPENPIKIRKIKSVTASIIKVAHRPLEGNPFYDERTKVAQQFFAMFEKAKDKYPEFDDFVARVLEKAD